MINIQSRDVHPYKQIKIKIDNNIIDLGLLNDEQIKELAGNLIESVWNMGRNDYDGCAEWFKEILKEKGIEL